MKRIAMLGLLAAPALAQNMFHGNSAHTGVYAAPGPRNAGQVKWTFKAGGPIVTSPSAADGVIYFGAMDGHLYAVAQQSGQEKWNFKSKMPIASSPAVADGLVYFVSSSGALAALDTATGKPKWVFPTEFERKFEAKHLHGYPPDTQTIPDAWDLFSSSPAVAGGKVYFGSSDGNVYALDAQTQCQSLKALGLARTPEIASRERTPERTPGPRIWLQNERPALSGLSQENGPFWMVGATGFEPATTCTPSKCATRLRYAPALPRQLWGSKAPARAG